MGTPEAEITDAFMELYAAVAATMKQFADDPIKLGEEPVVVGDLSVPYPLDWTVEELTVDPFTGVGFFADAADIAVWNADGTTGAAAFQVLTASTTELADLSARETAENATGTLEDISVEGEFLIGDTIGFGISGMDVNGYVYVVSMTPTDDSWMFYSLTAGDRETGEAAIPIFMAMLQQISAAE